MRWITAVCLMLGLVLSGTVRGVTPVAWAVGAGAGGGVVEGAGCRCCDCGGTACCVRPAEEARTGESTPALPVRSGSVEEWSAAGLPRPGAEWMGWWLSVPAGLTSEGGDGRGVAPAPAVPLFLRSCVLLI